MLFAIHCLDNPGAYPKRLEHYDAHRAHLSTAPFKLLLSGPLLSDDGQTRIGSLLVVDAPSKSAVVDFSQSDPFKRHGVWMAVNVHGYVVATDNWTASP